LHTTSKNLGRSKAQTRNKIDEEIDPAERTGTCPLAAPLERRDKKTTLPETVRGWNTTTTARTPGRHDPGTGTTEHSGAIRLVSPPTEAASNGQARRQARRAASTQGPAEDGGAIHPTSPPMEAASDNQADDTARPEAPKVGTKIRAPVASKATKREASYGRSKENEINGKPTEIWEGGRRETRWRTQGEDGRLPFFPCETFIFFWLLQYQR